MRFIDSVHPPGTIVIPMGDQPRFDEFYTSLERVLVPQGTIFLKAQGADVARNLNQMLVQRRGEWVWLMGDDHDWTPNTLIKLLDRHVPAIVPLVATRRYPFHPVIFHGPITGRRTPYTWQEVWSHDCTQPLPQGDVVGTAGLLVRESALCTMAGPYFESGKVSSGMMGEDLWFTHKLGTLNVPVYLEPSATLGHYFSGKIEPHVGGMEMELQFSVAGHPLAAVVPATITEGRQ